MYLALYIQIGWLFYVIIYGFFFDPALEDINVTIERGLYTSELTKAPWGKMTISPRYALSPLEENTATIRVSDLEWERYSGARGWRAYDGNKNIYRPETWEDVEKIKAYVESLEQ